MWSLSFPAYQFFLRALVVYFSVFFLIRFGGKREIGQMGIGEFIALLLISNAVQNSMNGGDNSITGGLILAATIIALSAAVSFLTFKSKKWERVLEGSPVLLVHNGELLKSNLERELLSLDEFRTKLRRQGIHRIDEISQAVLETNGSITVVRKSERGST